MLIYFGVIPYLVFDGDNLPSKACTENERAKRREESKKRGLELYKARKVSQAYPEFQKAVDVTPYMARQLIEELKKMNIQYVVAPYEADAQLAYLEKKGIINGILSEDSDLLVYGAKKLITKLDQHGDCIEINRSEFAACRDMTLAGFTDADFRLMAILSGCDYLASINKVGLRTAHTYVRKYKDVEKILRMLQFEQKFIVPKGYLEKFYEAERTFLHHRVFCPLERKLVLFTQLEHNMREEDMPYLGEYVDPEIAIGVACGDLDPMTKKRIPINVATASRSMPDLHRRQTIASASDLKPSKSIDNFFKPKRQPLAELDPNSLTPSPSQQRLLNQHRNASWEARPVSSAPQLRRTTSVLPGSGPTQAAQTQSSQRTSFLERAATLSTFQPSKRTRLCSDVDVSPSGRDVRSPFFTSKPEQSPLLRKKGQTKKARRSDMEIFSDDSVADIFQDMQQLERSSLGRPVVSINQPERQERQPSEGSPTITASIKPICDTPARATIKVPQSPLSQTKSIVHITASDDAEEFHDLLDVHVKQFNNLQSTFAYQPLAKQKAALQWLSPSKDVPQQLSNLQSPLGCQPREKQVAALQRLSPPHAAAQSAHQGQVVGERQLSEEGTVRHSNEATKHTRNESSLDKTFGRQSPVQQATALKSLGQTQTPAEKVKLGLEALDSAAPSGTQQRPLTPPQQLSQRALHKRPSRVSNSDALVLVPNAIAGDITAGLPPPRSEVLQSNVQGSEDLLVPNSEDEASELSGIDEVKAVRTNLDLTRFAFTANA